MDDAPVMIVSIFVYLSLLFLAFVDCYCKRREMDKMDSRR